MPHYHIDTDDDVFPVCDEEGQDLANLAAGRALAHRALSDMARHRLPDGEHRTFTASIRDERGTTLYVATLAFSGQCRVAPAAV
ncbi:DUF6894 family protein [Methylobacterium soli]|uniref:DUF6894 domain-containing protein n=1 Tax=Methylobacterium soli TaxID=553447 RepID=A0A6L3SRD0_9HYPH|nr:hypothetical protein [Methylobacterium soli]KAB1071101.1 hypothetical protein F6X53_29220 [Methylobacterium soli]GJE41486.1 hypothetical protein AEGHOMDF_0652 [Methylobacterium soli]